MRSSSVRWSIQRWYGVTAVILLGAILGIGNVNHAQTAPAQRGTPAASKAASPATKPVRQRLPAYFSKVVNASQRQQIYVIQASYRKQIERLQDQLSRLLRQRDQEVDLVLSPDQLQQVQTLRAAAAARRKQRRSTQAAPQKSSAKPSDKDNP
ncbi:MAG: hypothetical protein VX346_10230 [Planctomycetota bacterium]|nr:hypothetical protein [Planctomycetota bacterium]